MAELVVIVAAEPVLLAPRDAARVAGFSERTWRRMTATGRNPAPLRIGKSLRWRLEDLRRWADLGCPKRDTMRALANSGARGGRGSALSGQGGGN